LRTNAGYPGLEAGTQNRLKGCDLAARWIGREFSQLMDKTFPKIEHQEKPADVQDSRAAILEPWRKDPET